MKIFGLDIKLAAPITPPDPAGDMINTLRAQLLYGMNTNAGAMVNDDTVLSLASAFACMKVIAEDIAVTPLMLYQRQDAGGRNRKMDDRRYYMMHDSPNPEMTAFVFKEMMTYQQLLPSGGAAYAEIERNEQGYPKNLWPLLAKDVEMRRDPDTRRLFFRVHAPDGSTADLPDYNVLYIPGTTTTGYNGRSPAKMAANVIGLSLALEQFASLHFANGGFVKDYLKTPNKLGPDAKQAIAETWTQGHGTLSMAQRTALLDQGLEYVAVMTKLGDILPPEIRRQQVLEICRIFRISPSKVQDYGEAKWANIEQQNTNHYTDCLLPWFTRWEQACNQKLTMAGESRLYWEFLNDNFLRGDYKTRMEGYGIAMQNGLMSRNEVRARENLPPVADGDEIMVPMNMAPLSKVMSGEIAPTGAQPGGAAK